MDRTDRRAAYILLGITAAEATWVYFNMAGHADRFFRWMGFFSLARVGLPGWLLSMAIAILYIWAAARMPSVRANLVQISFLKLLAVVLAVVSGFCEEAIFRKLVMDSLQRHGSGVVIQLLSSAVLFGAAHSVWGLFRGSIRAAAGAMVATSILGMGLAAVYVVSNRVLAPCIVSHFLINLFIEPGLVLAAVRGEMGRVLQRD